MGAALSRAVLGVERPRVALLSNGEEVGRGSGLVLEAHAELAERARRASALRVRGQRRGGRRGAGAAEVIVTDGFTGNIALKLMEGVSQTMLRRGKRRGDVLAAREARRRCCCGGALRGFREEIDPEAHGRRLSAGAAPSRGGSSRALHARGFAQAILRASVAPARTSSGRRTPRSREAGACRRARCPRRSLACRDSMSDERASRCSR